MESAWASRFFAFEFLAIFPLWVFANAACLSSDTIVFTASSNFGIGQRQDRSKAEFQELRTLDF